jgi:hypothetical protein
MVMLPDWLKAATPEQAGVRAVSQEVLQLQAPASGNAKRILKT